MAKLDLPDDIREMFRAAGSKGGRTTLERHGYEFYAKISVKGAEAANAKRLEQKRLTEEAAQKHGNPE